MNERAVPTDDDEQNARCRALEFMVLLQALLDASWNEEMASHLKDTKQNHSRVQSRRSSRSASRAFFLRPANREHVETIADRAGLPHGTIWTLVDRFVEAGEDPAPLRRLYDAALIRPGSIRFDFDVAFVA